MILPIIIGCLITLQCILIYRLLLAFYILCYLIYDEGTGFGYSVEVRYNSYDKTRTVDFSYKDWDYVGFIFLKLNIWTLKQFIRKEV